MKKITLILLSLVIMAGFSVEVKAQTSASVPATHAGAVLMVAMGLTQTAPLHFGSSALTTTAGGTIVLPANSTTRTYTGGVATSAATPVATNAAYNVTGTMNETYAITLPTTVTVTNTQASTGVYQMDITLMSAYVASKSAVSSTGTLSATGTDSFTLGGTLTVKANQLGGIYDATFGVSVDYN